MTRPVALFALSLLVLAPPEASAQPKVEPGEWELRMEIQVPGMAAPTKRTGRECYTREDSAVYADPDRWAKEMLDSTPGKECTARDIQRQGTSVSMIIECQGGGRMKLVQDFRGATGTMTSQMLPEGGEPGPVNTIQLERVAEKCSPETIERWKQRTGKEFKP
jgi:hypothetical protein